MTRLNASGEVLDPDGLPICTGEGEQHKTSIVHGDNQLMVLWEDNRNYDSVGYDVYGIRVALDGTVLDPGGFGIAQLNSFEQAQDLCWTGETFLAVWQTSIYGTNGDVKGARVDTSGVIVDSPAILLSAACNAQIQGGSSWSGSSYLAICEGEGDLRGVRITRFGEVLDSATIDICSANNIQSAPHVIWGEASFLAVWEDSRNDDFDIYGVRIDSTGEVLDSPSLPIRIDPTSDQRYPAVDFDGTNYLVVWQNMIDLTGSYYRVEGLRISPEGSPIDPQPFSISTGDKGGYPDLAFGGGKYLVVWQDNFFYDIYGSLVDTLGAIKSQFGIRTSGGIQESPVTASDGNQFLVVWVDFGNHWPNADILATRVTSGGVVLDPEGIVIASTSDPELSPSVTFDGIDYLVAWSRSASGTSGLYTCHVTSQGVVLDPEGIFVSSISPYSLTTITSGPLSCGLSDTVGQSLLLYSRYQPEPYNSPRMFGTLFWEELIPNYPPQPFSLLLPVDQDTVIKPVFLDWEEALDVNPFDYVLYTVYLSSSDSFIPESTVVIEGLTASDYQVSPEKDGVFYWWKVKSEDRLGEITWSNETFSFDLESYGDVNSDGRVDLGDAVFLINYLFKTGPLPQPLTSGDTNGDCEINIGDAIYLINYLFKGGPSPVEGCA